MDHRNLPFRIYDPTLPQSASRRDDGHRPSLSDSGIPSKRSQQAMHPWGDCEGKGDGMFHSINPRYQCRKTASPAIHPGHFCGRTGPTTPTAPSPHCGNLDPAGAATGRPAPPVLALSGVGFSGRRPNSTPPCHEAGNTFGPLENHPKEPRRRNDGLADDHFDTGAAPPGVSPPSPSIFRCSFVFIHPWFHPILTLPLPFEASTRSVSKPVS